MVGRDEHRNATDARACSRRHAVTPALFERAGRSKDDSRTSSPSDDSAWRITARTTLFDEAMSIDPMELTFESLDAHERARSGPARLAAIEAGIDTTDAFVAVTDDDKTNLLSCARAKTMGASLTICLINDPSLVPLMKPLGIDAYINPRATTVSSILRHVRHGRVRAVYSLGDAEAEVIEAQVLSTSPIAGRRVREANFPDGAVIGAMQKGGEIIIPRSDTVIAEGDILIVFATAAVVPQVEQLFRVSIDFF